MAESTGGKTCVRRVSLKSWHLKFVSSVVATWPMARRRKGDWNKKNGWTKMKNLIIFQHTPGTYPRPPTNGLWRNSFHLGVYRFLGYAPRVCWGWNKGPWMFRVYVGDEKLPSYFGIIVDYKDLYSTTRIQWKVRGFLFVARMGHWFAKKNKASSRIKTQVGQRKHGHKMYVPYLKLTAKASENWIFWKTIVSFWDGATWQVRTVFTYVMCVNFRS